MKYQKAKIWVIDDEEDLLALVKSLLAKSFDVELFTEPEKLLKASEHAQPDLYVIDYVLPKKDGLQLLKELRFAGVTKPVIILSGATSYREALEFIQLGVSDLVEKPFTNERLLFSVSRAVAGGMMMEARDSLIVAYSELVEALDGMVNHYEFLLDSEPKRDTELTRSAAERVVRTKKLVNFIRQKQDMLDVMVGNYTEE